MRLSPQLNAYLRTHAFIRNISINRMVEDVLQGWVVGVTDPNDTRFSREHLGFGPIRMPKERFPGYLKTLGLVAGVVDDGGPPPPPSTRADHTDATPESEEDLAYLG